MSSHRTVSGLRQQDMFYNLRVPNQFQTDRDEINLLLLTGASEELQYCQKRPYDTVTDQCVSLQVTACSVSI